jgi:NAD(P)-dependent dehydrogenase (short-subunit alcohol dehydrogenase family)
VSGVTYDLAGMSVLVTGAAGGMGTAITHALAGAGADVLAADRPGAPHRDVPAGATGRVITHDVDVSDAAAVEAMVDAAVGAFGGLHAAVNAAAIEFETVPLADTPVEDYDRMMAVNARSVFLCIKYELRAMLAAGAGGSIVNVASTNAFRPQADQPAYTASKHAVLGLTRSAAVDYGRYGIRVNAICPGAIDTPMLRDAMARRGRDADDVAARLSRLRRFGEPDEIAQAALWLCSPASSFTTGEALMVDGGMLAG